MADQGQKKITRRTLMGASAAAAILAGTAYAFRSGSGGDTINRVHKPSTVFSRGNGAEPDTIDPHKASGTWENNIIGDMFMGLMTDDVDANAIPGAALNFTKSEDGLTYTFKLREHNWSDGKPVTAHDFVYSFRRILDPKTAAQYASILYPIMNAEAVNSGKLPPDQVGVRAIDDHTLEMKFHFQVPYIAQLLTHYSSFAVPAHVVEKYGDDWTRAGNIVSNGPYVLKEWLPNDHIRMTKNPYFYDKDNVVIEDVLFYPTQDSSAALKRFRAGEFDVVTDSIPPQQIDWLRANMPKETHLSPYILTQYVLFNLNQKPFDDHRVRRALSMAIDRDIMVEKITRAGETPAYALVPPGMPDYPPKAQLAFKSLAHQARVTKAKELLKEAGFGPDNPLEFDYNMQNTTETKLVSVAMQEMWRQVGAKVRLHPSESQVHYDLLRRRDFAVAWAGWVADYRDAKNYLFLLESSTKDLNYGDYNNPAYDALVDQSDHERDPAKRTALLQQAEQLVLDDDAIAPVFFGVARNLVSTEVHGWNDNNVNIHRSRFVSLKRPPADT